MSKFEETQKKQSCKLKKPTEKSSNVGNQHEVEKVLTRLLGAVKEVVLLLKCVIFFMVLFGSVLLAKN